MPKHINIGSSIRQLNTMATQFSKQLTTLQKNWKTQYGSATTGRATNKSRNKGGRQAQNAA